MAQGRLPTGVDRVCLAYVAHWGQRAQAVVQKGSWRRILPLGVSQALFALLLEAPPDFASRMFRLIARACVPPWPAQDAADKPTFYLGHVGVEAPGFAQWVRATRQKPVYFVHDLIPITHPEYCRPGEHGAHMQRLQVMLQTRSGLIGNSQATLTALGQWASHQGLVMPLCAVAHLAPAAQLAPSLSLAPPLVQPYFVALGTIEPRKNHLLLLNVWRELVARLGAATPRLVVIGQRGWECENVVDMLQRCEALKPFVVEIAACSDADLARYLQHTQALLFPSFAEGYGMPLVEALMLGTPVLASDLPVFHEIAGHVPDYLSPLDGPGWMQAVCDYAATPSARRSAQVQRMRGYPLPTWDAHFAQVERLLEQLA